MRAYLFFWFVCSGNKLTMKIEAFKIDLFDGKKEKSLSIEMGRIISSTYTNFCGLLLLSILCACKKINYWINIITIKWNFFQYA